MEQDPNSSALDNFQIEDVPAKMILLNPFNDERDVNLIVFHVIFRFLSLYWQPLPNLRVLIM